jgi:hypothetical protein
VRLLVEAGIFFGFFCCKSEVELVKFGLEQLLVRKLCLLLEEDDACGSCGKIYMRGGTNFRVPSD